MSKKVDLSNAKILDSWSVLIEKACGEVLRMANKRL
jgi:hypothetical protein